MFAGFTEQDVAVSGTTIHLVTAGDGPPLLLVHGYPQTHVLWRKVAPALAEDFTVVAPDLRGYGRSGKPPSDDAHNAYAKRTMAQDLVDVMAGLGHGTFAVAGHDRGARVSYRMALDHPQRVTKLALLDILPTATTWSLLAGTLGLNVYHWFFLAQRAGLPETLIGHDPRFFLRWTLDSWLSDRAPADAIEPAAFAAYEQAFRDPDMIRATCEDYRAGATVDIEHDQADQAAGRKIACPLLVLWGEDSGVPGDLYLDTWRRWADDVRARPVPCGHFLPEEAPDDTLAALREFLAVSLAGGG